MFDDIARINAWLDRSNDGRIRSEHDDSMRVMKIGEEYGEAVQAYIGMVGQNPRKGITHSMEDLLGELADVAVTALCAIQHFTGDARVTRTVIAAKIAHISVRAGLVDTPIYDATVTAGRVPTFTPASEPVPPFETIPRLRKLREPFEPYGLAHIHDGDETVEGCPGCFPGVAFEYGPNGAVAHTDAVSAYPADIAREPASEPASGSVGVPVGKPVTLPVGEPARLGVRLHLGDACWCGQEHATGDVAELNQVYGKYIR